MICRAICTLVLATGLSSLAVTATADKDIYYKWVDEEGTVHYGEQPSAKYESTAIKASSSFASEAEDPDSDEQEVDEATRLEYEKYCKIATDNLSMLTSSDKIQLRDEYGNVRELNQEERLAEQSKAQAAIQKYCPAKKAEE
jgi:hypothetical protein